MVVIARLSTRTRRPAQPFNKSTHTHVHTYPHLQGYKAWLRLRVILGLAAFPILGNLIRLGSERLVATLDVRDTRVYVYIACVYVHTYTHALARAYTSTDPSNHLSFPTHRSEMHIWAPQLTLPCWPTSGAASSWGSCTSHGCVMYT